METVRRIVCHLTGNVDSAVAALILKRKGFRVTGLFVKNPYESKAQLESKKERVSFVAKQLDIELEEVDLPQHHWRDLENSARNEYLKGRMPDLGLLYEKSITFGAAKEYTEKFLKNNLMATAHYARTSIADDAPEHTRLQGAHLFKGVDQHNDDSAVLAQIPQRCLRLTVLPLGEFTKEVVVHIARSSGLGPLVADSTTQETRQDLANLREAVLHKLPSNPGVFRNLETYEVLGPHEGLHNFIIGQRVQMGHTDFWVAQKDFSSGDAMLVPSQKHIGLYSDTLFTALAHWTYLTPYNFFEKHTMVCDFRLRAHEPVTRCQLTVGAHNEWCGNDHIILSSTQPLYCVTPGQLATFYHGEEAIGSAVVLRPGPSHYAMYPEKRNSLNKKKGSPPSSSRHSNKSLFFSPLKSIYERLTSGLSH